MKQVVVRALSFFGTAIVVAAMVSSPAAAAVPAGALWASPKGSGTTCSKAAPCSIVEGFSSISGAGGTLVLDPGHYGSEASPVTAALEAEGADVEGEPGKPAPTIVSDVAGSSPSLLVTGASHLKLLDLSAGDGVVAQDGVMDHVTVFADTTKGAAACASFGSLVTNSLCVNTGVDAYGLGALAVGSAPLTVQATTAVDTRSKSAGLVAGNVMSHSSGVVTMINDIADGGSGGDVTGLVAATLTKANTKVVMSYCDAKQLVPQTSIHGKTTIHRNHTDITGTPKFVSAAGDNFAERASSPTINRGVKNLLEGTTDVSGQARDLGSAPDIGAYEFAQPPAGLRITVLKTTAHTIRVKVSVNPEGLTTHNLITGQPATKRLHHTLTGNRRRSYTITIKGLKPTTRYTLKLRATNSAGSRRKTIHASTR
jgi:hypothetical protein